VRRVDPEVTGVIVQIYESGALIWRSYVKAGAYALVAVFVLVWIDFRRIPDAALCLVPVAAGFAVTFGIMWIVGVPVNHANIIVLPLMFGIGVDAGVHIIHRHRMDPSARPLGLTAGTGKGISMTSYTTIIGFAALMVARHRGIQSLGFVMAVGIAMTMLACWIIMPAWLELRQEREEKRGHSAFA
jgi:predicted RND superfamily exporter protein